MTEDEFAALRADNKERQTRVPAIGAEAPDFEIERLDRTRRDLHPRGPSGGWLGDAAEPL